MNPSNAAAAPRLRGGHAHADDGTRLAYLHYGTGPTLLFVHGGLGEGLGWRAVTDRLADRFHVVLLDRRAHGRSDWGGGPDLDAEAGDVRCLIAAAGPIAGLIGHSYGATVCLVAALQDHQADIPRLVLYEPALRTGTPLYGTSLETMSRLVEAGAYEEALLLFLTGEAGTTPAEVEMLKATPAWPQLVGLAPTAAPCAYTVNALDLERHALESMTTPTLLLRGGHTRDQSLIAASDYLARRLPAVSSRTLDGQTHHALLTAPELVADAIGSFLG